MNGDTKANILDIEEKYHTINGVQKEFGNILWEHYRHGIAHWRADKNKFLDPDIPDPLIALVIKVLSAAVLVCLKDEYWIGVSG